MKITNTIKLLIVIFVFFIYIAILWYIDNNQSISIPEENVAKTPYLLLLILVSSGIIYMVNKIIYTSKNSWRVNIIFLPFYLLLLFNTYKVLPINDVKFDFFQKIIIGIFYVELAFLSGMIKKDAERENMND